MQSHTIIFFRILVLSGIMLSWLPVFAATVNSSAAGNWSDGTKWSSGTQPASGDIVNVNHVMNLNSNLSPSASSTITFFSGSSGSSGAATLNMSSGVVDVRANVTFTGGGHNLNGGTIYVRNGATLTIGSINAGGTVIIVEAGGSLVINGNINNNGSSFQIDGNLTVNGSYSGANSSANVTGSGTFTTSGSMNSMNGGAIFGNANVSCSGPCNGNSTCGRTASVSASPSSLCAGASSTLTGSISSGSPTAYQWESSTISGGGFSNISGATSSTYSASPSVTTYYRIKITVSGCITKSNAVVVTVNATPSVTSTSPGSRCGNGTVTLGATASSGTLNWYTVSSGGSSQGTGTSFTTPVISTTTNYYVDASSGGCTSARSLVAATVNTVPSPVISAGGSTTFCSGCSVSLSSTAASSYSWSTGESTQSINVSSTGSYTVTVTAANGCQGTSSAMSVTTNNCTDHSWTGSSSADWSAAANWNKCSVPGSANDVIIPNVVTAPVISTTANCRSLTLNSGASLTINSGGMLNIYSDILNNGSYTDNGTTVLSGSSAQTVSGAIVFNNLTLNNSNGAVLSNAATVKGILSLTSGVLNSGGNLTVNLNTGSISGTGSGSISGDITLSRSIGSAGYHYVASPLSGLTVNDWNDDVPISTGPQYLNLYAYEETYTDTVKAIGWEAVTSLNYPLTSMKGFALYFREPATLDVTGGYSHSAGFSNNSLTNTVSSNGGVTNAGSDGWHLIGNPYPSAIDWDASSGWTKINIDNAIYFWDPVNNRYTSYIGGIGINGGTRYIPSMQSFWIKANAAGSTGTLGMNNNVRTTTINPTLWRTTSAENILKLTASSGKHSDETIIRLTDYASENFDDYADAYKLNNEGNTPSLYTEIGSEKYSINSLPDGISEKTIPVKLKAGFSGSYTFTAEQIGTFNNGYELLFIDSLTGVSQNILTDPIYTTEITQGETSARFYLTFKKVAVYPVSPAATTQQPSMLLRASDNNVCIRFVNESSPTASILVSTTLGQVKYHEDQLDITSGEVVIKLPSDEQGIYIVRVTTGAQSHSGKIYITR